MRVIDDEGNGPDFFIVGMHKAGTTSLFSTLSQHSQIMDVSIKEPHYYCHKSVSKLFPGVISKREEYLKLFEGAGGRLCGDASVFYSYYCDEAIKNIKADLGSKVKILMLIRDPVERAYSAFMDESSKGEQENLDFYEGLLAESDRMVSGDYPPTMFYTDIGLTYNKSVELFKENFVSVKIIEFEDLISMPDAVLTDIQEFLDVNVESLVLVSENTGRLGWSNPLVGKIVKQLLPRNARPRLKSKFPTLYDFVVSLTKKIFFKKRPNMDEKSREYLNRTFQNKL